MSAEQQRQQRGEAFAAAFPMPLQNSDDLDAARAEPLEDTDDGNQQRNNSVEPPVAAADNMAAAAADAATPRPPQISLTMANIRQKFSDPKLILRS